MTSHTRRARLPLSGRKKVVISEAQWELIEQSYGQQLPLDVRAYILLVTEALSAVANVEQHGPALNKMKTGAKQLRDSAQSLLEVADWPTPAIGCESFTSLIDDLATAVRGVPNDHLQFLIMVQCVTLACNLMLSEWDSEDGWREGFMWDAWVQGISEFMEHSELPTQVRKDTDKRDPDKVFSPFVSLIKELQKHLPAELRRHDHSTAALEQAIHRARKSNRWPMLLPPNVRERYAPLLESYEERLEAIEKFKQDLRKDPNWVEDDPGRFVAVDSPFEKIRRSQRWRCWSTRGERDQKSSTQNEDDSAQ
jgi:hypothetical protein